jgi:hypothetical protein
MARLIECHIVEACEKVLPYTTGMARDAFAADEKRRDAVLGNPESGEDLPPEARRLVSATARSHPVPSPIGRGTG